jgi:uncharacterized phosphosugar-binding protein
MLALEWLENAHQVMDEISQTQMDNIKQAAVFMADSIEQQRWVHTFGCGHATIPVEEMYPRIGGFVGFHPMIELPLTFFTHIVGEMGIHQFLFLERAEGFGNEIMKSYNFDPRDTMWLFSHSGINQVNIDIALKAKEIGMKVITVSSVEGYKGVETRHSSGKKLVDISDIVIDSCVPAQDASITLKNHQDKIGPVSSIAFITVVWMVICTVAERLVERGVRLYIHPSHNVPGDTTARDRLSEALKMYKKRIAGV